MNYRSTEWDGYLIKTDLNGNSGCHENDYTPSEANANLTVSDITNTIGVMSAGFKTSILGEDLDAGLEVYPLCFTDISEFEENEINIELNNPFSSELHIQIIDLSENSCYIVIRDILGKKVYSKNLRQSNISIRIPTLNWENGIYIVEIQSAGISSCAKIIKQ